MKGCYVRTFPRWPRIAAATPAIAARASVPLEILLPRSLCSPPQSLPTKESLHVAARAVGALRVAWITMDAWTRAAPPARVDKQHKPREENYHVMPLHSPARDPFSAESPHKTPFSNTWFRFCSVW